MSKKKRSRRDSSSSEDDRRLIKRLKKLVKKKHKKKSHRHRRSRSRSMSTASSSSRSRSSSSSRKTPSPRHSPGKDLPAVKDLPTVNQGKTESSDIQPKTNETERDLSEDVLNVIGQRLMEERVLAPAVHSSFAVRWEEVLKKGLPKEEKEGLVKKYPPPSNCTFLEPPKLNAEVVSAMNDVARNRDKRIVAKQEKLVACLAGISKTISTLLARESAEDVPVIEALSDVCRLITDSMHDETAIRRSLILANVNSTMKDTLNSASADEYLFGAKLAENIKTAKQIEQSAEELKAAKFLNAKPTKNTKGPPRYSNKNQTTTLGGQKQTSQSKNQLPRQAEHRSKSYSQFYKDSHKKSAPKRR